MLLASLIQGPKTSLGLRVVDFGFRVVNVGFGVGALGCRVACRKTYHLPTSGPNVPL